MSCLSIMIMAHLEIVIGQASNKHGNCLRFFVYHMSWELISGLSRLTSASRLVSPKLPVISNLQAKLFFSNISGGAQIPAI